MTENALDLDIQALQLMALEQRPGEWVADGSEIYRDENQVEWVAESLDQDASDKGDRNAAFIVAAVNALPRLIARVRELEAAHDGGMFKAPTSFPEEREPQPAPAQQEGEWEYGYGPSRDCVTAIPVLAEETAREIAGKAHRMLFRRRRVFPWEPVPETKECSHDSTQLFVGDGPVEQCLLCGHQIGTN